MARISYSARFSLPDLIERGQDSPIACPVYRAGSLVAPASGTYSVYDASGTLVQTGAAVLADPDPSVASALVLAASTASASFGEGWRIEWSLLIDGATYRFRNDAALVRSRLAPVVSEIDLYRVCSSLDPHGTNPITTDCEYAEKLDEAWIQLQSRLLAAGNRPNLITSPSALREVHILLTLALIFSDLATRLDTAYSEQATSWKTQFHDAWARCRFSYAPDDAVIPDPGRRAPHPGGFWITGHRGGR